jgi:hypothetical protein
MLWVPAEIRPANHSEYNSGTSALEVSYWAVFPCIDAELATLLRGLLLKSHLSSQQSLVIIAAAAVVVVVVIIRLNGPERGKRIFCEAEWNIPWYVTNGSCALLRG